jgi:hypothetical protein
MSILRKRTERKMINVNDEFGQDEDGNPITPSPTGGEGGLSNDDVTAGEDFEQYEREMWAMAQWIEVRQHSPCGCVGDFTNILGREELGNGVTEILQRCLHCGHEWKVTSYDGGEDDLSEVDGDE